MREFRFLDFFPLFCCFHWLDLVYFIGYQLVEATSSAKIFFPLFFLPGTFGFLFGLLGYLFGLFRFLFLPGCLGFNRKDAKAQRIINARCLVVF